MRYRSLADGDFRLLQILPGSTPDNIYGKLSHHRIASGGDECLQYTALSYCWGSSKPTGSIVLDGHTFPAASNLLQALKMIVQHHLPSSSQLIWIDAVCINQADLEEKAEQVRQMWRIFHNASLVYAWLGAEDRDVQVLDESKHLYGYGPDSSQQNMFSDVNLALLNLSRRTYFTRTWTRPEFLRARILCLISGGFNFDWEWVMRRIEAWPKRRKHEALPANTYQLFLSRGPSQRPDEADTTDPAAMPSHLRFQELLRLYSRTGCGDARDRIYSMLSDPVWPKLHYATWWIQPDYRLSNEELALLVLAYYDYLVRWDFRRSRHISRISTLKVDREVCDSVMTALETTRTKVRALACEQARAQAVSRPDRLDLRYGFEVECVGPLLKSIWNESGIWQERPA